MKLKLLSAAVLAAGLMFGMGGAAPQAEAGVRIYLGVPGGYYGHRYYRGHRHRHCHRYRVRGHGWVRRCHRHRHGGGHHY